MVFGSVFYGKFINFLSKKKKIDFMVELDKNLPLIEDLSFEKNKNIQLKCNILHG